MSRGLIVTRFTFAVLLMLISVSAHAAKLQIKIRATNKTDTTRPVKVRSSLPPGVTTNDIISTAGLDIGYDVKSDTYFVYGTIDIAPMDIVVRDVEIRDIWVLSEDEIRALSDRAAALAQALARTDLLEEARAPRDQADALSAQILREQRANSIMVVPPVQHIAAFEENRKRLSELRESVGKLEDLALAEGIDVGGELLGAAREAEAPRTRGYLPETYGDVTLRISVFNPSVARIKPVEIHRELPRELGIEDVLESDGLTVREDAETGCVFLSGDGSTLPPRATKLFQVKLRDKWNVHEPRIAHLREYGETLHDLSQQRKKIPSVAATLSGALARIKAVEKARGPSEWSSDYVAFYRQQGKELDEIEAIFNRVDEAIAPLFTKQGFAVPAPDRKTTWLVIWSILGFLGIVSLLFFIRWFGRSE